MYIALAYTMQYVYFCLVETQGINIAVLYFMKRVQNNVYIATPLRIKLLFCIDLGLLSISNSRYLHYCKYIEYSRM